LSPQGAHALGRAHESLSVELRIEIEKLALRAPFRISDRVFESVEALVATVTADGIEGRGEAQGVYYLGETAESMRAQIEAAGVGFGQSLTRSRLQALLPPGGARNALDCALWDLEAKQANSRVWDLIGLMPRPLRTAYTLSFEPTAKAMAERARELFEWPVLKVKLGADEPVERIAAIRSARPDAELMVDANQAWTLEELSDIAPNLKALGVTLIEQPLCRNQDSALEHYVSPIPLCADESCLSFSEIAVAARRYQMINIKLDKAGGLTEALWMAREVRARRLGLMVGNMGGSSLSMAPSFVIGLMADTVDLDGPLDLVQDRVHQLQYRRGIVHPPTAQLWG